MNTGENQDKQGTSTTAMRILNQKRNQAILVGLIITLALLAIVGLYLKQHLAAERKVTAVALENRLERVSIGNCTFIAGACGNGTFNQPTYYLDRINFACPADKPLMNGFKLERCGELGTENEGLQVIARCCNIVK